MDKEKIIEKLLKIKALADGGQDGEAQSATFLLKKMLFENGLTMDDLLGIEQKYRVEHVYKDKYEKRILIGISGKLHLDCFSYKDKRKNVFILEATKTEHLEFERLKSFYVHDFTVQLDAFVLAYIHKNRLYATKETGDGNGSESGNQMSQEEINRIIAYMKNIEALEVFQVLDRG